MPIIRFFVYVNVWIALGAASLFWGGYLALGGTHPPLRPLVFLFCSTLLTYNLHWLVAGRRYCAQRPEYKYQWYSRHYRLGWVIFGLAFLGELWAVLGLSWREWLFFGHLGAIALLYNWPEHRGPGWLVSIRRIPFLKIFLIAYLWAALGAGYPALLLNALTPTTVIWFMALLLYILAITLPFDVRDLEEDREKGLRTLPHRWGLRGTKQVGILCLALSAVGMGLTGLSAPAIGLWVVGAGICVLATYPRRPELYFTGIIDGLLVLAGPCIYYLG